MTLIVASHVSPFSVWKAGHFEVAPVLASLGEALAIAAVLAVLVDRRLKEDVVLDIAQKTSELTSHATTEIFFREFLGGQKLPLEYYSGMRKLATTNVLSLGATWTVYLDWDSTTNFLVVRTTIRNTLQNVGDRPFELSQPWLMSLRDGRPPSRLERYEVDIFAPAVDASRAERVSTISYSEADLAQFNGSIRENGEPAPRPQGAISVDPGVRVTYIATGVTYQNAAGLQPLLNRYPTLSRQLRITGPALRTLDLTVISAGQSPVYHGPGSDDGELTFQNSELVFGNSVILLQWSRSQPERVHALPQQSTADQRPGDNLGLRPSDVGRVEG
jgi:hypothetical protein